MYCAKRLRLTISLLALSAAVRAQVNVLTSDYGKERTGANLYETQLTVANVTPGSFGLLGILPVDGEIFGQPLYVSGVTIPGQGQRNIVFVTTEHNTVYAYDADSAASPALVWNVNLGQAVPSSTLPDIAAQGLFIDVNPEIGILSTPAIDLGTGVMYVVAETLAAGGQTFQLHALDLATGQERMNGPVTIAATVAGDGGSAVGFDPTQHLQRPGLLLANGAVYVAFGSHADFGAWHGWVMSYNAADLTNFLGAFATTATGNGGAVWQSGRGLAGDDAGNLYFATGNGDYDGRSNFSESFVKLSGPGAALADWYTPANWQSLSDSDLDISAGPAIIPGTHTLIGGDKGGNVYVVNGDAMGHLDPGGAAQVTQAVGGWIFSLALWARPEAAYLYLIDTDLSLKEFAVNQGVLDANPVSASSANLGTARVGMALSANGGRDGTGILWATTGDYFDPTVPATLHAYDASNLGNEIWNSQMNIGDALTGFAKFTTPTVANGRVYAATDAAVMVYGLLAGGIDTGPSVPVIAAVENSASYNTGTVAPGELITIFGINLGPATPVSAQPDGAGNIGTVLAGVEVLVDGTPAPVLFAGPHQVNAVAPFGTSSAVAQVQVTANGLTSQPFPIKVQPSAPGLFAADSSGSGQALALNGDGTANGPDNPAARGSVVVVYATGGGQTYPAAADGTVSDANHPWQPVLPVTAAIGDVPATVVYAGSAPGIVDGILQVNVVIPPAVSSGASPIVLTVGGQSSQNGLTVSVE